MTARAIANRFLEADEDFDVEGQISRLASSPYPGIELELEGRHWNVYKLKEGRQNFIGEITYDDMADMPRETMTPEQIAQWEAHPWTALAGVREAEQKVCASFEEALQFILAIHTVKTTPYHDLGESEEEEDIEGTIARTGEAAMKPVSIKITDRSTGYSFRVTIKWDEPVSGTAYDKKGRVVPQRLQPIVEFYDLSRSSQGQFVSSYYAATLVGDHPLDRGLDLHAGVAQWQLDAHSMSTIIQWIKQIVEARGYKLRKGEYMGSVYEGIDPDDPESFLQRLSQQSTDERIEIALRRKLRPYYPDVRISKRPGLFNQLGRPDFKDSFIWTIHCKRDTPLPLSIAKRNLPGYEIDWRSEVKHWFEKWATHAGLSLFKFEIYGRLRKDPTFQFETARLGPLQEEAEDITPEAWLANYVDKADVNNELKDALWKWHPFGVSYNVMLGPRGGFALAVIYFPPEKDDFYKRFEEFVVSWVTKRGLFTVNSTKLTGGQYVDGSYPTWGLTLALNSDWPKDKPPYTPSAAHQ